MLFFWGARPYVFAHVSVGRGGQGKKGHSTQHRHRGILGSRRKRRHSTEQHYTHTGGDWGAGEKGHSTGTGGAGEKGAQYTHTHVVAFRLTRSRSAWLQVVEGEKWERTAVWRLNGDLIPQLGNQGRANLG